jgi:transcription initiation factor TFIIIB Brf1 subunit/transcription initiation factor TFIIB
MEDTLAAIWSDVDRLIHKPTTKPVDNRLCIYCSGDKILTREGMVCTDCGTVDHVYIEETAEWTSGITDDGKASDPSRCTIPSANHELFSDAWGKGTVISTKYSSNYETKRMAKINFHNSMNHKDRSLFHAYRDIDEACNSLPETVLKDAKSMYKKFNEGKLTRGAVRAGIKANCVLYACRLAQIPRTTKEIADMFGIQSKDISRTTQIFTETIKEEKTDKNFVTKPFNVMQRLLNAFDVTKDQRFKCNKMCSDLESCVELMSKSPNSVATAVIFLVLGSSVTKSVLSEKCNVSVPTLNKIVNIAKRHLEE